MNNQTSFLDKLPAFLQLCFLLLLALVGAFLFTFLSYALIKPFFGVVGADTFILNVMVHPEQFNNDINKINALKFIQLFSTIGAFLVPSVVFAYLKKPGGDYLLAKKSSKPLMYGLALLLFIASIPLINYLSELNQMLRLPSALKVVYDEIKSAEETDSKVVSLFLNMPSMGDLIYSLIVIAIIPAIAEEFLFRGCIQRLFIQKKMNPHVAIWLTGAIFSFIHFQFFGFVPRLLLGALLGYVYYYSGSIWVSILAHTFNNGAQVVAVYLFHKGIISVNLEDDTHTPLLYVLASLPIVAALFYALYKNRFQYPIEEPLVVVSPVTDNPAE